MKEVYIEPANLGEFHYRMGNNEYGTKYLVAQNEDSGSEVYISDDDGMPLLTAVVNGIEVEHMSYFEDSRELEDAAVDMIDRYLEDSDGYQYVDAYEYDDEELDYEETEDDEELDAYREEIEEFESEFSEKIDEIVRFLAGDEAVKDCETYWGREYAKCIEQFKEDVCMFVSEDLGLLVRRPTITSGQNGPEFEEFPYA